MSCDCAEYKLRNNSKCGNCNCLDSFHLVVLNEITGAFPHIGIRKGTTATYQNQLNQQLGNGKNHWFSIRGVESITLTLTQQQICLGLMGLSLLLCIGFLIPLQIGLVTGSLFSLRLNSFFVFGTSALTAYRAFRISKLVSKKVTMASLFGINAFLALSYILMGIGLFPRLTSNGALSVEPARYIQWLVVLPFICHLVGDITSNSKDMTWFARLGSVSLISMFFAQISPSSAIMLSLELSSVSLMIYGLNRVFQQLPEEERMMDKPSTFLARAMILSSIFIIQITWMLETCNLLQFATAELVKTIADIILVCGTTLVIIFADMKELLVC